MREAGLGARPAAVCGDATSVDDRGRAAATKGTPGGSYPPESSAAGVFRGLGAD